MQTRQFVKTIPGLQNLERETFLFSGKTRRAKLEKFNARRSSLLSKQRQGGFLYCCTKNKTRSSANCRESAHLTSLYRTVQKAFQHVKPFKRWSRVWQTDGRTDGQIANISNSVFSHTYMCAKMNIQGEHKKVVPYDFCRYFSNSWRFLHEILQNC